MQPLIKLNAFYLFAFFCGIAFASDVFGDKPGRGHGHSDNRRGGPSISRISISPHGFQYDFYNRDVGISINRGFVDFEPSIAFFPTPEVLPVPYVDSFNEFAAVDPGLTSTSFENSAFVAFKAGQYEQAQRLIEHALIEEPDNPYLLLYASHVHFANGNFQRAAIEVELAINLLPQNEWDAIIRDFENLYGRNDYVIQMSRLERYCFQNPTDAFALTLRGFHFGCLGHPLSARRDFEKAIAVDPTNSLAQKLLESLQTVSPPVPILNEFSTEESPSLEPPTTNDPELPLKSVLSK